MRRFTSLDPLQGAARVRRRRLTWKDELVLASLPTVTILAVLLLVEVFARQRLLFSSLASSAFLIYLDPEHGANAVRTLILAHLVAALAGFVSYLTFGTGYLSGGAAMVATIVCVIFLDAVHPPAVATSLGFAFRGADATNLVLFLFALFMVAFLVSLERATLWLLARFRSGRS
ncbi:MAG: HPP family protein [Thermodesulfobacteriota bacterium]